VAARVNYHMNWHMNSFKFLQVHVLATACKWLCGKDKVKSSSAVVLQAPRGSYENTTFGLIVFILSHGEPASGLYPIIAFDCCLPKR